VNRRVIVISVLGFLAALIVWNMLFFGPAGKDVDNAHKRYDEASSRKISLQAQLQQLQGNSQDPVKLRAQLAKLQSAVPKTPDLEGFIRSAYDLKRTAGVDWVSIQPTAPAAGTGPTEIKMQIVIFGGFFQVLDYLNSLEQLQRVVIIDGINVQTGGAGSGSSSGSGGATSTTSGSSSGAPSLSVTLTARMFTQAAPAGATSSKSTPGGVTPTTAAATTPTSAGASN
jgi:Tfp pilus assembly protein PilO